MKLRPFSMRKPPNPKRLIFFLFVLLVALWGGKYLLVRQMVIPRLVLRQPVPPLKSSLRWPDSLIVASVAISPDGSEIFSGSAFPFADPADKRGPKDERGYNMNTAVPICVWDARTGKLRRTLNGHHRLVDALTSSPDGRLLASSGWDGTVRLWDIETGKQLWSRPGNTPALTFSPDSTLLAVDGTVWRVSDGQPVHTYNAHINQSAGIAYSPDGQTFACVTSEYNIPKNVPGKPLNMHVTGQRVQLWDVATGKLRHTLPDDLTQGITFSPDSRWLVSLNRVEGGINITNGASLHCRNTQSGLQKWTWSLDYHQDSSFLGMDSLAYSPNGKWIVSEATSHDFFLFRDADGTCVRRLHLLEWSRAGNFCTTPSGLGFSQDGKTLAGRGINTVQVWDTSVLQ